jgi:hypothetical protein
MGAFLGVSFIFFFLIVIAALFLPTIFFLLTQQRALSKCSPANQTMSPGLVWLQIIPFFGFIWQFFVVVAISNSLEKEFAVRRIPEEPKPGQGIGLAMCITRVCVVIPFLGIFSLIASVILWIIYWVKIAALSQKLDSAPGAMYSPPPYGAGQYGYGSGGPGVAPYGGAYQPPAYQPPAAAPPSAGQTCAACGASVPTGQAFCSQCGTKVGGTAS